MNSNFNFYIYINIFIVANIDELMAAKDTAKVKQKTFII